MEITIIEKIKWRTKAILSLIICRKKLLTEKTNAKLTSAQKEERTPICFIGGCGRSGTTLLGHLLSFHEEIIYHNEPREKWAAINEDSDIWGYWKIPAQQSNFIIAKASKDEKNKFLAVFSPAQHAHQAQIIVEKTPENAFRLQWLMQLMPDAKFIHIMRNGVNVIHSILVESSFDIPYGFKDMNNWYGRDNVKKNLLFNTARFLKIDEDVLSCCQTAHDIAALEWICSIKSIEKYWHEIPSAQRFEVKYEDLLKEPLATYSHIINFLNLHVDETTLNKITSYVKIKSTNNKSLKLSTPLNLLFNSVLMQYNYPPIDL